MDDIGFVDDGIDWEFLLENVQEMENLFEDDPSKSISLPSVNNFSNPSTDSILSLMGIEQALLGDDDQIATENVDLGLNQEFYNDFLSDLLVDLPADQSSGSDKKSSEEKQVVSEEDKNGDGSDQSSASDKKSPEEKQVVSEEDENGDDSDPMDKKRKRQLRNKDAALRSRERKKMYVRDLEMKTKYLEGECRRMSQFLHYCYAENQALRLQLQKGSESSGAYVTKQESAVLVMESLLLGSLLWLIMGIVWLFDLPQLPPPRQPSPENRGRKMVALPKEAGSKTSLLVTTTMFSSSRRCKASRTRMKPFLLVSS